MKLKEYIDKYGTPVALLARRCNLCVGTMHKIVRGVEPGLRSAIAIQEATEGNVTLKDLLRDADQPTPSAKRLKTLEAAKNKKTEDKKDEKKPHKKNKASNGND